MTPTPSATEDTIAALATPEGAGAIGVIRVSGKQAIPVCNKLFRGKDLEQEDGHTLHYGTISDVDGQPLDEVVVSLFRAPRSYTKEDVVEISCHGAPYILQKVLDLLTAHEVRLAEPGEFTMRAFLNGQMDLSQAEAVADLIQAGSDAAHRQAMQQMRGGFSKTISELRQQLTHFASMVELELDFSEEDVAFADKDALRKLVKEITGVINRLIESFALGNVIKEGVPVVIAGRPNAGKSTLLNKLLNEERAIVSEIPGTTRDVIEEAIQLQGITFRFMDTAGLREAAGKIETIGIERTYEKIKQAAVVLYLFDVTDLTPDTLQKDLKQLQNKEVPLLVLGNKIDRAKMAALRKRFGQDILWISASAGTHLDKLKTALVDTVRDAVPERESVVVTNTRHHAALRKARKALGEVREGIDAGVSGDMLALDIRTALDALGTITGEVTSEDILGEIFSNFCIGK